MSEPESEAPRGGDNVFPLPNSGRAAIDEDRREGRWNQRVLVALLVFALLGLAVQTARSRSLARDAEASAAELAAAKSELVQLREQVAVTRDRVGGVRRAISATLAELRSLEVDLGGDPESADSAPADSDSVTRGPEPDASTEAQPEP
jgi:cell division protein FtsB